MNLATNSNLLLYLLPYGLLQNKQLNISVVKRVKCGNLLGMNSLSDKGPMPCCLTNSVVRVEGGVKNEYGMSLEKLTIEKSYKI